MSNKIAQRRGAKAARRKKVLAERRKLALTAPSSSLAARVRALAKAPLHGCLLQDGLFERGNGTLILARKTGLGSLAVAVFLLDAWCLGVKDTVFLELDISAYDDFVAASEQAAPSVSVEPAYARKLLRELVAYARGIGFEPQSDYAALEALFGDARAEDCEASFTFGCDGKPLYVPGPSDTRQQIRQRIESLRRRLGEDGFDFLIEVEEDKGSLEDDDAIEDEDLLEDEFPFDNISGYDPEVAPDPAEWRARSEQERLNMVQAYHRRAGISLPSERAHTALHVVIENQIAAGDDLPARRTIERLIAEGLDRHDALHAVASVLTDQLYDLMQEEKTKFSETAFNEALAQLTAESWRRRLEEDEEYK
jgi:hypothetical protein